VFENQKFVKQKTYYNEAFYYQYAFSISLQLLRWWNKNKAVQFLGWLVKRKIMLQNRYDLNTCLKLGYVMRNQKISYFIISITCTSGILFTCYSLRNDTHSWLWGRSIWKYMRIIMPDDMETDWDILMRYNALYVTKSALILCMNYW